MDRRHFEFEEVLRLAFEYGENHTFVEQRCKLKDQLIFMSPRGPWRKSSGGLAFAHGAGSYEFSLALALSPSLFLGHINRLDAVYPRETTTSLFLMVPRYYWIECITSNDT